MTEQLNPAQPLPPVKVAFVIDNQVVDILHTDERLAAIFLSNPIILDVTDGVNADPQTVDVNYLYNPETQEFTKP